MTDFDDEYDVREYESRRDCAACGLLPREDYRAGAPLAVREGFEGCGTDRLYRQVPVRIDGTETTLLVGAWCELEDRTTYRMSKTSGDGIRRRWGFVAVELAKR